MQNAFVKKNSEKRQPLRRPGGRWRFRREARVEGIPDFVVRLADLKQLKLPAVDSTPKYRSE
jgi:hypothetical protein